MVVVVSGERVLSRRPSGVSTKRPRAGSADDPDGRERAQQAVDPVGDETARGRDRRMVLGAVLHHVGKAEAARRFPPPASPTGCSTAATSSCAATPDCRRRTPWHSCRPRSCSTLTPRIRQRTLPTARPHRPIRRAKPGTRWARPKRVCRHSQMLIFMRQNCVLAQAGIVPREPANVTLQCPQLRAEWAQRPLKGQPTREETMPSRRRQASPLQHCSLRRPCHRCSVRPPRSRRTRPSISSSRTGCRRRIRCRRRWRNGAHRSRRPRTARSSSRSIRRSSSARRSTITTWRATASPTSPTSIPAISPAASRSSRPANCRSWSATPRAASARSTPGIANTRRPR